MCAESKRWFRFGANCVQFIPETCYMSTDKNAESKPPFAFSNRRNPASNTPRKKVGIKEMNRIQQFVWACISAFICVMYKADVQAGCTSALTSSKYLGASFSTTTCSKITDIGGGTNAWVATFPSLSTYSNKYTTKTVCTSSQYFSHCGYNNQSFPNPTAAQLAGCTFYCGDCPNSGVTSGASTVKLYTTKSATVYVCSTYNNKGTATTGVYGYKMTYTCTDESALRKQVTACYQKSGGTYSDTTGTYELSGNCPYEA